MGRNNRNLSDVFNRVKHMALDMFSDDQIEIHSNTYALITGCKKLTEYNREKVSLSFRDKRVEITGADLEAESLINGQMALKGTIRGVNYIDY